MFNYALVYKLSVFVSRILPLWLVRHLGRSMAAICYIFCNDARLNVKRNLQVVLVDRNKAKKGAWYLFLNYGTYLADWAKFFTMKTDKVISKFTAIEGKEVVLEALSRRKGAIILTAHLGNWELGGIFFSNANIPINVVTGLDEVLEVANIREQARVFHNINTITLGSNIFSSIDIVRALDRNELVAMLIDRYAKKGGIKIDFFGKPAYFPLGPVSLARVTGAAIIPAFTVMKKDGTYKAIAGPVIDMEFSDNENRDIVINLTKIVSVFESHIKEHATQWYNFLPIWNQDK